MFVLAGLLPAGLAVHLGRLLGWFLCHVVRLRRRDVAEHLRIAFPDRSEGEHKRLLGDVYRHFGLLAVELSRLPRTSDDSLRSMTDVEGLEHVQALLDESKGALVLCGHLGNWELCLASCVARGMHGDAVVKEIKGKAAEYAATRMRSSHNVGMIPRHGSIKQILASLREGRFLVFVLDQNMSRSEGVFVDFFGKPACTMSGLATLAGRSKAPVIPVVTFRYPDLRRHCVRFLPPVVWEDVSQNRAENIHHNTQRYTKVLEDAIREHPDQWIWMHHRWRAQPIGQSATT